LFSGIATFICLHFTQPGCSACRREVSFAIEKKKKKRKENEVEAAEEKGERSN